MRAAQEETRTGKIDLRIENDGNTSENEQTGAGIVM
jgi:hypothetical protein